MNKLKIIVVSLLLLVVPFSVNAYSNKIIPGGENVGIEINSDGLLIVGFYKVNGEYNKGNPELLIGDYITEVNGKNVRNISEFIKLVNNFVNEDITLTVKRDESVFDVKFNLIFDKDVYKTGLYVKDRISGIGTITYYDPETKIFGALGHGIFESNTNKMIEIRDGFIYSSDVTGIDKSVDGLVGSKNAKIKYENKLGTINDNNEVGIYGTYEEDMNNNVVEILPIDEVKLSEAVIYTVLDNNEVKEYEIEILKVDENASIKNIYFKILDDELIKSTGGVVQGMSGSPILQDGKIIGAVTHAVIDDVKTGYGVAIETMLKEGEN